MGEDVKNKEIKKLKLIMVQNIITMLMRTPISRSNHIVSNLYFRKQGMVVFLYVYEKEKHLEDILTVMRFLEVQQ